MTKINGIFDMLPGIFLKMPWGINGEEPLDKARF